MEYMNLYNNRLSGEIPPALGNLTRLSVIELDINMLSGAIPSSLGMLSNLSWLNLAFNNLSGSIPASVWNISSLVHLSVQNNMLSGVMPQHAFAALHKLQELTIDHNQFHGRIPASLANASDIRFFQITDNFFSGTVPPEVGKLTNLVFLVLADTFLEAEGPKDWEFITTLTNCSQLTALVLGNCKFGGVLPDSISNLSTSLQILQLARNKITGPIPKDIGNLISLQDLELSSNSFTGYLPSSMSRLKNLALLYVFENKIRGSIPWTMGNLTELNYLYLSSNAFSGRIPITFGNLTKLLELGLSGNNLTGSIPNGLLSITTLSNILDLSDNSLEGSIPQEIGNLQNLVELRLGSNRLSGQIPTNLGECRILQNIYLQNNFLMGSIPPLLSQLKGLQILDLSSNNLSGQIPTFLGNLTMLYYLNLSFNSFVGEVPTFGVFANATAISLQGNGKLCGGKPDLHLSACSNQLPKKKHNLVAIPVAISLVATLVVLALLYKLLTWHKKNKSETPSITSMQGHPSIPYAQLVRATDGFSTNNLLGSGSFGSVYKGELDGQVGECANVVAVKVLKLQTNGALKSFIAECKALRKLRHRNLVKIFTVCSSIDNRGNDFKAIIFDFMPNGSLESWLHPDTNEEKYLNLLQRVSILLDVANALDYLHSHGPTPVVHCDLKPSNVLLDAEMVAHVGDFGLSKILVEGNSFLRQSTSSMGFRGTIGYAPPG